MNKLKNDVEKRRLNTVLLLRLVSFFSASPFISNFLGLMKKFGCIVEIQISKDQKSDSISIWSL